MVTENKSESTDLRIADALCTEPEDINDAMRQWRTLKDFIDAEKAKLKEHEEKVKYLEGYMASRVTVPDDGTKSETVSVPGAGLVYKERLISATVTDWEAWRKYLVRHGYGAVARQQNNIAPLQELYEQIMDGELPMPQSAEFKAFEKPRFRRN